MGLELRERVDRERGPQILDTSEVSLATARYGRSWARSQARFVMPGRD